MPKDYDIARPAGACLRCGRELQAGDEFMAVLAEADDQLLREDYCLSCWDGDGRKGPAGDVLGTWRTRVPRPKEKKRLFVDDDLLVNFFQRLADANSPAKMAFRYVLALVLMRKRLLVYDRTERPDDGTEVWNMHLRGSGQVCSMVDPKMDQDRISEVSQQLGQILEAEV